MHIPDDHELVVRAQKGDVDAVGELYDRHHTHIFRYVWSRLGQQHGAEDLTGEVFMKMLVALPSYRPGATPFRAWLYRIARNMLVDHYRKERGMMTMLSEETQQQDVTEHDPPSVVEEQLAAERVQQALTRLERSQREVVVLRFLSGLSLREVALTLNKSESAIKALQHRGLAALRLAMQQDQEEVSP